MRSAIHFHADREHALEHSRVAAAVAPGEPQDRVLRVRGGEVAVEAEPVVRGEGAVGEGDAVAGAVVLHQDVQHQALEAAGGLPAGVRAVVEVNADGSAAGEVLHADVAAELQDVAGVQAGRGGPGPRHCCRRWSGR
jgi:hypothetical protein